MLYARIAWKGLQCKARKRGIFPYLGKEVMLSGSAKAHDR